MYPDTLSYTLNASDLSFFFGDRPAIQWLVAQGTKSLQPNFKRKSAKSLVLMSCMASRHGISPEFIRVTM